MNALNKFNNNEIEDDFPLPPPPDSLLNDIKNTNLNEEIAPSRSLSFTKSNQTQSSFLPQNTNNNVNSNSNSTFLLKRSQTLSTNNRSSSSPLNRLSSRFNSNRNSISSFASQTVKRLNLFTNDINNDLEEESDENSLDSEEVDIELHNLNNHNTSTSPSCSKENTSSSASSSASSVIYSTNNAEDLNKLNDSSTTNNSNSDHYQTSNSSSSSSSSFKSNVNQIKSTTQNEKLIAQLLLRNDKTNESLIYSRTGTLNRSFMDKPAPPSRSSSLQYRANQTLTLNQKSKFLQLMNNINDNSSNVYSAANTAINNNNSNFDRNSIYSTFSMRASNLTRISSFNLKTNNNNDNESIIYGTANKNDALLLNKSEVFKIETCYKSMCSIVNSSKCMAELHTTNLDNLVKLLDWKHQLSGVPVWVFNTGLNPKRKKELTLVIADKSTGFALWKLNNMSYLNDFKWTKPGHLTFKIYASNLSNPDLFGLQSEKDVMMNDISARDSIRLKKKFSLKKSNSISYNTNNIGDIKTRSLSIQSNVVQLKENYIFGALKFDCEFECSKFYDYYRSLMVDPRNDDLFNPNSYSNLANNKSATLNSHNSLSFFKTHKEKHQKNTNNIVKVLYRKITKNSISSPCAFTHVNGLSAVNEDAMLLATTAAVINCPPSTLNVNTNIIDIQQSPLITIGSSLNDSGSILQNPID